MTAKEFYNIEEDPKEVVWYISENNGILPIAYCNDHLVPFSTYPSNSKFAKWITCPHDNKTYILRNRYDLHQNYVKHMSNRELLRDFKVVRIEASGNKVLAKERYDKDSRYFIETKLSDTAKGLEVMIQVGKRDGNGKKVQIFVAPPTQRMGYDISGKDIHPSGIFTEVRAMFKDSVTVIENKKRRSAIKKPE